MNKNLANQIPNMSGQDVRDELFRLASEVKPGRCVVEVGAWLGAGTAYILGGLKHKQRFYIFDRWKANFSEQAKARIKGFNVKGDIQPIFEKNIRPFVGDARLLLDKVDIRKMSYSGGMIGLYVDDAAKRKAAFDRVMRELQPRFVPMETKVVLMDYFYYEKKDEDGLRYQKKWMEARQDEFKFLKRVGKSSTAIFLYLGR